LTRQEFEQIADSGAFDPEERLELIEGEILTKKLPVQASRAATISLIEIALCRIFREGYDVRSQLPLALGERNEPLPDVAVVVGSVLP
jgi:Uma2 family endonuclease